VLVIKNVIDALPDGIDALRAEARAEGFLFVERLAEKWESGDIRFDRPGEALLAAFVDETLAGSAG